MASLSQRVAWLERIKHHRFMGKMYRIIWRRPTNADLKEHGQKGAAGGLCDFPNVADPDIFIDPRASEAYLLELALHETDHATDFGTSESIVTQRSSDRAAFLRRMGWRLCTCGKCRCPIDFRSTE